MKKKYLTAMAFILAGALVGCGTAEVSDAEDDDKREEREEDENENEREENESEQEALDFLEGEAEVVEDEMAATDLVSGFASNLPIGEVIYEDDNISVTLGGVSETYIGPELQFVVTNKTDGQLNILIKDVCLNGIYLQDVFYSDYVQAGTDGTVSIEIPYDTYNNYTYALDDPTVEQLNFTVSAENDNEEIVTQYVPATIASAGCPDTFNYEVNPEPLFETEYYAIYDMGYAYTDTSNMAHFNFLLYTKESDSVALFYDGLDAEMGSSEGMIEDYYMPTQMSLPCDSYYLYQAEFSKDEMDYMEGQGIQITAWPSCYTDSMDVIIEIADETIYCTANDYVDYSEEINNALADTETVSPEDDYIDAVYGY